MRLVAQRVFGASVSVYSHRHQPSPQLITQSSTEPETQNNEGTSTEIGRGLVVLVGIGENDTKTDVEYISRKALAMRLWPDLNDQSRHWASSVMDNNYDVLVVSQFTLLGHLKKGNKPDFHAAMEAQAAKAMFNDVVETMRKQYKPDKIKTGFFQEHMILSLKNDGPVTIQADSTEVNLSRQRNKEDAKAKRNVKPVIS